MEDTMQHTLINPNQLRHFGTKVQDNTMSMHPLSIIMEDNEFCMELFMDGTIVFVETFSPSAEHELCTCPHIHLSSAHPWNPARVKFPKCNITLEEEVGGTRYLSSVSMHGECWMEEMTHDYHPEFCLNSINRAIASMKVTHDVTSQYKDTLICDESIDTGRSDVPLLLKTFQSSSRHSDVSVAGGHTTEAPSSLTYSSVVSRDSVRIALTSAALNDLSVLACDIQNAYLTAPCREKIWTIAGPEFGPETAGKTMLIVRALYGLKTSGAAFRAFLADTLHDLGFTPSLADPDVWMRPAVKENFFKYWELVF
jgi:hypothetical protein